MLSVLKKHERDGNYEKARRLRSFALAGVPLRRGDAPLPSTTRARRFRGALISPKAKHYAAITDPVELGGLLRAIDVYEG